MVVKTASGAGGENCCRAGAGHEFFDELQIFINLMGRSTASWLKALCYLEISWQLGGFMKSLFGHDEDVSSLQLKNISGCIGSKTPGTVILMVLTLILYLGC